MKQPIANVTICRQTSNFGPDRVSIQIGCESSGLPIVEVIMSLEEFATCLTGLAHSKGTIAHSIHPSVAGQVEESF